MRRSREDFVAALENRMRAAALLDVDHIDVNAGELHRAVGGYPGPGHNMPGCCAVMNAAMRVGDVVLGGPPSGIGASLTIRYRLPRDRRFPAGAMSETRSSAPGRRVRASHTANDLSASAYLSVRRETKPQRLDVAQPEAGPQSSHRIGLVGCVKSKLTHPAPASDLYISPLFLGRRAYVSRSCSRWLILSALHGLVRPETFLEPYDVSLNAASGAERRLWAAKVLHQLDEEFDSFARHVFEIHAGANYTEFGLVSGLRARGATIEQPVAGLTMGEQLAFYASTRPARRVVPASGAAPTAESVSVEGARNCADGDVSSAIADLDRSPVLIAAADWPADLTCLDRPGLYGWWVDDSGAGDLSRGLGLQLASGRIYAGQAGATRWPSGTPTNNTLGSRVGQMHLGGRVRGSTFRWTLAAILLDRLELQIKASMVLAPSSEQALTEWMHGHLSVAVHPHDDRDSLDDLERKVLARLDLPLNLQHMAPTSLRQRLTELRRRISRIHVSSTTPSQVSFMSPRLFAELPGQAQASFARVSAAVRGVVPTLAASWPIVVSELPADAADCSLLGAVRDWAGESKLCLYYFDCSDSGVDLEAIEQAFVEAKAKAKGTRAFPRLNSPSGCLYVGSSQSIAKRLGEHLGYGAPGTYALQLSHWARPLALRLELCCAVYADTTPYSAVQVLEDALWERKVPMFGRQGRK